MQATLTFTRCLALGAVLLALGGCSVRQEALNRIGDALAGAARPSPWTTTPS
jgi:hypothetical protein